MANSMLELYSDFKENKQYDKVDKIRAYFKANKLAIKDMKTKIDWAYEE
jgi:cysteinyl-tRNA synthetase